MPTRPTTDEQKRDAQRASALFDRWLAAETQAGLRHTQESIAHDLGYSQSTISQRLSGKMAMNAAFAAKLAALVGCSVADFSPTLAAGIAQLSAGLPAAPGPAGSDRQDAVRPNLAHEHRPPTALDLPEALSLLGMALAATPANRREALATNLAGWARDGGADHWRLVVLNLLNQGGTAKQRAA